MMVEEEETAEILREGKERKLETFSLRRAVWFSSSLQV